MHLITLLRKEFTLELRRKSVISGLSLYLFNLVFIYYITFRLNQGTLSPAAWSVLFWLTVLFSVVNSVAKSFIGERKGTLLYFYSLLSPQVIIASKIIYNTMLAFLLSFSAYVLFRVFIDAPVSNNMLFVLTLLLSSWGFAASLSLISALAAKANNSQVLMAVLSFPVLLAILFMAIRLTMKAIDGMGWEESLADGLNLIAVNTIATTLSYLLFPYIWRS